MPSNETAKTKSAPKHRNWLQILVPGLVVLLLIFFVVFIYVTIHRGLVAGQYTLLVGGSSNIEQNSQHVLASKPWKYTLKPARTAPERDQGLSDTKDLAKNAGMLFIFDQDEQQCFWMKDMHYALDIIWVNSSKAVTHMERNLSPKTYPKQYCATGQYVIELNAGEADKSHMYQGQQLRF